MEERKGHPAASADPGRVASVGQFTDDPHACALYIGEILRHLSKLANGAKLGTLAYLIDVAALEAAEMSRENRR